MSTLFVNNISHTNDTTAMTIDTSGRVSRSVIPAFFVYNNTNNWISNETDIMTNAQIENAILNKAKKLKLSTN